MAEFQLLRCMVALGGDRDNVVARHRGNPVMFPELPVLQHVHGDLAITDVYVVGVCDMPQDEALNRLRLIYGNETVNEVFPGARPRLPTGDRTIPPCTQPIYVPKPARPANPDPQLRPLAQYTETRHMPRIEAEPVIEDEPTADEIAAHSEDDAEEPDFDLPHVVVPDNVPDTILDEPLTLSPREVLERARAEQQLQSAGAGVRVQDQPQSRVSFRGQARQARATPSHLPDVQSEPPTRGRGNHDHDRARG